MLLMFSSQLGFLAQIERLVGQLSFGLTYLDLSLFSFMLQIFAFLCQFAFQSLLVTKLFDWIAHIIIFNVIYR